ncbi:hypothetical protein HO173_000580 [Letharia columbiana]|uniref:PH domain-like protein n=1 Tax=Letharia columbiana TaxID=112416 RepID=A0A8H6G763_9LECA|nr:uncharacterized protein HO173_000580 [Letharia columbiana]KAF6241868.1 hypothetical protein HO173_000580 [Letharia columbiana]
MEEWASKVLDKIIAAISPPRYYRGSPAQGQFHGAALGTPGACPGYFQAHCNPTHGPHARKHLAHLPLATYEAPSSHLAYAHSSIMATTIYASHHPQPSDNELEYTAPANPTITNDVLNLSVLQRHLPSTVSIDFLAPYSVVYIFSTTTQAWEKSGIEGTLFVVKLRDEGHAVVVLNRRGLDNFVLHLKSAEEVDVTDEYIILQGNSADNLGHGNADEQKVYGLWIFEEEQGSTKGVREACGRCIVECAERAGNEWGTRAVDGQSKGYAQQQSNVGAPNGPDLMALLNLSRGQGSNNMPTVQQPGSNQDQGVLGDLFRSAGANL